MIGSLVISLFLGGSLDAAFAQASQPDSLAVAPTSGSGPVPAIVSSSGTDELYRIGPGDVIDISVAKNDTLSRGSVRVNNDGMIQVPMIETDIRAGCKTERELANDIKEQYLKFMHNPHVYVAVKEYNSQPVAVLGAVNAPGRFLLQRRVRLLELLTFVNGPSVNAGRTVQIVHTGSSLRCDGPAGPTGDDTSNVFVSYNLEETLVGNDLANPIVQSGDIIRVTDAEQAFLIGSVKSALTIMLKEPVTLSEAIARAGGTLPGSNIEKVRILRQQSPGSLKKDELIVNLKAINKRQQDDVLLQANDVVDVPGPSGGKKFFRDLYQTLVPMVTRLPMSVIY